MRLAKQIYNRTIEALGLVVLLMAVSLLCLLAVLGLHWEGIISVEPLMVVLNHAIDNALRIFFEWLLN